jgi:hypothetical protein
LQTGAALGVAIVMTVAVSRSQHYLAAHKGANPLAALTEATSPPSWPAPCWSGSAWRWRSCSPADRGSQRTNCQSRTRRPMPLPQQTW